MSALNIALPSVSAHFQASAVQTSWILLSYLLTTAVLILFFGRMSDMFGLRKLYLTGVAIYAVTSLLCGFAPNVVVLLVLRVFQAVGAASVVTNTTPLITEAFPRARLGQALGANTFILSVSQLVGPAIGGYVTVQLGWQYVFWLNIPFLLICLIGGLVIIRPSPKKDRKERFDTLGNLTVLFGLGSLVLGLSIIGEAGLRSLPALLALAAFVVFFVFFLRHERRVEHPMIDLSLFKNRRYSMAILAVYLNTCAQAAVVLLISLHTQYVSHMDAQMAGLIVLPVAVGTATAAPVAGMLTRRFRPMRVSTFGLALACVSMLVIISYAFFSIPVFWLVLGGFAMGVGDAIFRVPNTTTIMLTVPDNRKGVANGIRTMSLYVGRLTSTAVSMMLITAFLPGDLKNAVFRGQAQELSGSEMALFSNGFQLAFIIMLVLCLGALFAYLSRKKDSSKNEG